jgi:hypothetical protein
LKSFIVTVAQGTSLGKCEYVREARLSCKRDNQMMIKERRERKGRRDSKPGLREGKREGEKERVSESE